MTEFGTSGDALVPKTGTTRLSPYRYAVIACLSAILWAKGTLFNLYVPFVSFLVKTYGISQVMAVLSTLLMQILYTPFSIFVADRVIVKYGTKFSLIAGCILLTICMIMRCGINVSFYFVIVASVIGALGRPLAMNIPAKISFQWFDASGRVGATTIPILAANLGGALGNFIPLIFIDSKEEDQEKAKSMMLEASIFEAALFSAIFLIGILLFKEKPEVPPSEAAAELASDGKIDNPGQQLKELIGNKNVVLLLIIACLQLLSFMALQMNSALILKAFGIDSPEAVVWLGATYVLVGLIGAGLQAFFLGRTQKYKLALFAVTFGTLITYVLLFFCIASGSILLVSIASGALGFFNVPVFILILEFCCEVSYPVDGAIVSGLVNSSGQVLGFISSMATASLLDDKSSSGIIFAIITSVIMGLCIPLSFLVKEDLRRTNAKTETKQIDS